jgi:cytoskeletal protein RodZ
VGAFGEKLRQQRELRGLSLEAISTTTKISTRMLRAIEAEHFDQLPGGVFNKGFVRAYARQVGLDEDEAVADYLSALRESQIQASLPNFRAPGSKSIHEIGSDSRSPDRISASDTIADLHTPTTVRPKADRRSDDRRKASRRSDDRRSEDDNGGNYQEENKHTSDHTDKERHGDGHVAELSPMAVHEKFIGSSQPDEDSSLTTSPAFLSFLKLASEPLSPDVSTPSDPSPITVSTDQDEPEYEDRVSENAPAEVPDHLPRLVPWGKLVAFLLLITLALALWTLHRRRESTAAAAGNAATRSSASQSDRSQPAASSVSPSPVSISSNAIPSEPSQPSARASSSPAIAASLRTDSNLHRGPIKTAVPRTKASVAAKKSADKFTLLIRATQNSWISITADGQSVATETLIAPAHTSVRAAHEVVVKANNPAGISFLLNGKEISTSGHPGEVRIYIFDATGLRSSAAIESNTAAR